MLAVIGPGLRFRLRARASSVSALLVLLLLWPPGDAQGEESEDVAFFGEVVDVNVVNVEVFVTDKKGAPVTGLTVDDFAIAVDGRAVEISNFYTPTTAAAAEASRTAEGSAAPEPGRPVIAPLPAAPPVEQRLNLIVFIDNFNVRPLDRNKLFPALREFLVTHVGPADRVMLVSYGRSVKIDHPFTSDPRVIARALVDLENTSGHRLQDDSERDRLVREIEDATEAAGIVARVRMYARSIDNDLRFTVSSLKSFVEPLAGLPGRKAILHVSNGFPMMPAQDLFYALQEKFERESIFNEALAFDQSMALEELAATANANRVTFYTIDAGGLRVHSAADVDRSSGFNRITPMAESLHLSNIQSPIRLLADTTGGVAIVNTNDIRPGLERVADDFRTFYSLGFVSPFSRDGRYHEIEVTARDPSWTLRYREGFRDKSVGAVLADATRSALLFDTESNSLEVTIETGAQTYREDGKLNVTILVEVPFARIVLAPEEEEHVGRLRLSLSAMAEDGGTSPLEQVQIPIRLPSRFLEVALRERFVYELQLIMRPGRHKIAVGLRDEIGGETAYVTKILTAGAPTG